MKKTILVALAILLCGTTVLPGCFYYGYGGWDPDHDERWERDRHEGNHRERHGSLTSPYNEQRQRNDPALRGPGDNANG
jgi:hypothetical protein